MKRKRSAVIVSVTIAMSSLAYAGTAAADDLTLDKFKDKRISEGDQIRARFETDGKNTSKSFKKAGGGFPPEARRVIYTTRIVPVAPRW